MHNEQAVLDIICAIVVACVFMGYTEYPGRESQRRSYFGLNLSCLLMMLAHASAAILGEIFPDPVGFQLIALQISMTLYFVFFHILVAVFCRYISSLVPESQFTRQMAKAGTVVCVIASIFWCLSPYFDILGRFERGNVFVPGPLYSFVFASGILVMLWSSLCVLINARELGARSVLCLQISIIMPAISALFQSSEGDIYYMPPTMAMCSLLYFVVVRMDEVRHLRDKEVEWMQTRLQMTIRRLEPHFLYNSLNSIYYLCDKDPAMAKQAIGEFSHYLRGNMQALALNVPISFEREMAVVQYYLHLEQLRFEGEIQVEMDLESMGFSLPALTVQPLVENSIKHGLYEKEGGTIWISSWEDEKSFHVRVRDDGVGFNIFALYKGELEELHTGLKNVEERLMIMCGGRLDVTSYVGEGTTVEIQIPREEEVGLS